MSKKLPKTIDEYILAYPSKIQAILKKIRQIIKKTAPDAVEALSYQMPTFKFKGKNLVHFAAWEKHIGFYPTPSGIMSFKKEFLRYKGAKGSIRFPLNKSIPLALIAKVVKFRVKEILKSQK